MQGRLLNDTGFRDDWEPTRTAMWRHSQLICRYDSTFKTQVCQRLPVYPHTQFPFFEIGLRAKNLLKTGPKVRSNQEMAMWGFLGTNLAHLLEWNMRTGLPLDRFILIRVRVEAYRYLSDRKWGHTGTIRDYPKSPLVRCGGTVA